ncbi:type II toxin-antitoxin system VapB family antitoxin [Nocardia sp. NPDC024068]|uniref:type II toxin-antitoxin system VapB family antitoxin n=1 Tax=Nocardia sp. NPDC024068 TaxID=3157197 RepID=UPI0033EB4C87
MTKTLIDIPDELMEQARQIAGGATKTETVRTALRLLVRQQQQHDAITWLADHEPFLSEEEVAEESKRQPPQ